MKTLFLCLPKNEPKMPRSSPVDKAFALWTSELVDFRFSLRATIHCLFLQPQSFPQFRYHPLSAFFPLWKISLPVNFSPCLFRLVFHVMSIVFVKFCPPCPCLCPVKKWHMGHWLCGVCHCFPVLSYPFHVPCSNCKCFNEKKKW